ncbi:unnamed protein product [Brassica rapa]|uniref:Uncharacterized protein n=1 Tax=Brassica campestris TaxID=3711 RepID=A0A8D9M3K3_BRACM|nr:unnamed protein product [Brassica rapa]
MFTKEENIYARMSMYGKRLAYNYTIFNIVKRSQVVATVVEEKTVEIVSTMVEEVMVVKDHIIHNGGSGRKNSGDDDKNDGSTDSVEE